MPLDPSWYTEQWAEQGAAISLKIREKVHVEKLETIIQANRALEKFHRGWHGS